mmetsp:Transcript_34054/g.101161  ORF Transcript_34054/g.101161 Transcript_34054/m.101161 type:complete len:539 (+) Transcript_34054:66-1682(+)
MDEMHSEVEALQEQGAMEELRERDFRDVVKQGLAQVQGPPAGQLVQAVRQYFEMYDLDNNGTLGLGEFCGFMLYGLQPKPTINGKPVDVQDCFRIFADYDQSGDDNLSLEELMAVFISTGPVRPAEEPETLGEDDEPFIDSEFPPEESSLGSVSSLPTDQVQWIRADQLGPGGAKLFDNIEPNDICQGYLGDCWLLAAMASAAEFSGLVESLFLTKKIPTDEDEAGKYHLRLFDGSGWREIVVDDHIPTFQGKPAFTKPADNELWAMILEKAVAKLCGDYHKIEGGYWNAGWLMFTGCADQWQFKNADGENGQWTKSTLRFSPTTQAGIPVGGMAPEGQFPCDQMWNMLKQWDAQNFMMGAGTFKAGEDSGRVGHSGGEHVRADGIVKGHAYSLLQCVEADADGERWRMVQLRNPWGPSQPGGESTEWNGRFSDGHEDWEEYPELAEELNYDSKDDGIFWMTWEDFVECFDGIFVSGAAVPVPKRDVMKKEGIPTFLGGHERFDRNDPTANARKKLVNGFFAKLIAHVFPRGMRSLGC